ncbi:hypothetical protein [Streptomyces hirsutus]|nr:hypothetical protein [Streptomyces hirsutus]
MGHIAGIAPGVAPPGAGGTFGAGPSPRKVVALDAYEAGRDRSQGRATDL